MRQLSFILSFKSILSNGKEKNEQCTSASLPCVKGGGPRSGGRIVSGHKDTFYSLSDGKEKSERCTSASLPCVKGGGPRSGGRIVIEHKLTFTPFKSFLSDSKAKNECGTRVSLHLLEGDK